MTKLATLATHHSNITAVPDRKTLDIELYGGAPWFGYVWIDDVCYTLTKKGTGTTYRLKRVR